MSHLKKRLELFRYPAFTFYVISCFVATVGSGMSYIAITWLALSHHGNIADVAIVMLAFWLPGVVLGPFMGVVVDSFPRRNHLIAFSTWARAIALTIVGCYLYLHFSFITLFLLTFTLGTFFSVYIPAAFRLTREIVPEDKLLYANATIDMLFEIGNMIGMGLAGYMILLFKAPGTFLINAALFVIAGVSLMMIRRKHINFPSAKKTKLNILGDFVSGLRYIRQHKALMLIYSVQLLIFVQVLTSPVLLAPFAKQILHTSVSQFGHIEMCLSIGAVVGGLFMAWFADKYGLLRIVVLATIMLAVTFVYFSYNRSILMAELLYFAIGVIIAVWPLIVTHAQEITNIDFQGRVQSCFNSISGLLIVIIYILVLLTSKIIPVHVFYWLECLFALISLLLLWRYQHQQCLDTN